MIIGLTGGIASGKSAVAQLFSTHGVDCVDADQVARDIVAPGEPTLMALTERYGKRLLLPNGQLDRQALRGIIFTDRSERRWVETLMHPVIRQRILTQLHVLSTPYALLMAPLLFETGLDALTDRTLVIDVPEAVQRARLKARDRSSDEQISAILNAQLPREERLRRADDVIDNSLSLNDAKLVARVAELDHRYRQLSAAES